MQSSPVKLGSLARDLGIDVFKSSLDPGISGLIEPSPDAPSGFQIKINRHEAPVRQRFTLAHEISHFLLHQAYIQSGVVDNTMYRSKLSDRKEVEANKLASDLIMPYDLVSRASKRLQTLPVEDRISELAQNFRVSEQAMRIRLGV